MDITLIVGAGASRDIYADFGLGIDLLQQISDRVTDKTSTNERYLSRLLMEELGFDYSDLWQFVYHLEEYKKNARSPSIDEFLVEIETFPEFAALKEKFLKIGLISIMFHILGWEWSMELHFRHPFEAILEKTWAWEIIQFIEKNNLFEKSASSLQIITFNYDRTIEYLLSKYFKEKNKENEIKKWIYNNVFHVYGKVGDLDELEFGFDHSKIKALEKYIDKFQTIYQQRNKEIGKDIVKSNDVKINDAIGESIIANSNYLAAFGFNFDYFNCRQLGLNNIDSMGGNQKLIANIFPYNDDGFIKRREMSLQIRKMTKKVDLKFLSCKQFLQFIFKEHF